MTSGSLGSLEHSMRYPGGKNVLNPEIKSGWPLNSIDTRSITPGVSMLQTHHFVNSLCFFFRCKTYAWLLKSFIMSRNWLYTSGRAENCTLTWSRYVSASRTLRGLYPPPLLLAGALGVLLGACLGACCSSVAGGLAACVRGGTVSEKLDDGGGGSGAPRGGMGGSDGFDELLLLLLFLCPAPDPGNAFGDGRLGIDCCCGTLAYDGPDDVVKVLGDDIAAL